MTVDRLQVGDRVLVADGYDGDESEWLAGGGGYPGTVMEIFGKWAAVELDRLITLEARGSPGWADFGGGSAKQLAATKTAEGRWLALALGWVDQEWEEPFAPLQVGLCATRPDLRAIPDGGGIGAWVESHATMTRLPAPGNDA